MGEHIGKMEGATAEKGGGCDASVADHALHRRGGGGGSRVGAEGGTSAREPAVNQGTQTRVEVAHKGTQTPWDDY